uniref:Uncharacterized protein n=1 Tax=Guillardia theta TaxID=55529 RepID=A0A7S4L3J3_GUITH|mmetsp:Transcript_36832/g.115272  ORF Transcript_36832/g.115272 Transcript_36832/m.115272 type:complete len:110 (+) Transcript_36832:584-913(+)
MIRRLRKGAKISGKRYAITATIHSLRFSESIPWHSSKVWYHENARECAELDSNFQEVAILWKRKVCTYHKKSLSALFLLIPLSSLARKSCRHGNHVMMYISWLRKSGRC